MSTKPTLYTMSTTTPGAWQQFMKVLQANPQSAICDLRPRTEPIRQDEIERWMNVERRLYIEEVPPDAKYHYVWLGLFLPDDMNLPVRRLISILRAGYSVICFDRSPLAEDSLRQKIASLVMAHLPDVIHEECGWKNTPLRDEPKLVRFLCTIYGHLQDIGRVEVEIEGFPGGYGGTPHNEATEVRVYGQDGEQRLPDFTLPYWQATLDAYTNLFDGDKTKEDKLKSIQDFLIYEHEYLEAGLDWPAFEGQYASPMIFDLRPMTQGW